MENIGKHALYVGDNLKVMETLQDVYINAVDCIYIDPPYNTGNKYFLYDDTFAVKTSWYKFMKPRLEESYKLLKQTGTIIVSIDDKHYIELKTLLNEIYGEQNFIANIIWQGTPSSLSKYTSGGTDYLLIYGKDIKQVPKFREPKQGAQELLKFVETLQTKNATIEEAQQKLRQYLKTNATTLDSSLKYYNRIDSQYRVFTTTTLDNNLYRPNLIYPITNPKTGETHQPPPKGWKLSPDTMSKLIEQELIAFDGGKYPRKKILLTTQMHQLPPNVFYSPRQNGTALLKQIIGPHQFPFPKNVEVLQRWLTIVTHNNPEATILDFFAGSGTTTHAVLNMNKADNGKRKSILITNNENKIPETITIPRIKNLISGQWFNTTKEPHSDTFIVEYQQELNL
jgi:adenine-specific DNA-methyltransferase